MNKGSNGQKIVSERVSVLFFYRTLMRYSSLDSSFRFDEAVLLFWEMCQFLLSTCCDRIGLTLVSLILLIVNILISVSLPYIYLFWINSIAANLSCSIQLFTVCDVFQNEIEFIYNDSECLFIPMNFYLNVCTGSFI